MKFCVLTSGGDYGFKIATMLREEKIKPHIVLVKTHIMSRDIGRYFRFRTVGPTVIGGKLNSDYMVETIRKINPHYILLDAPGILKQNIIETARIGVVNSHPGLLPWFRNVGVVGRSLIAGCPVGATLHFVDDGIDTGPMLLRELLPIHPEWSLKDIEQEANNLSLDLLIDFAVAAERHRDVIPKAHPQPIGVGKKYTWLSEDERTLLDYKIRTENCASEIYAKNLNKSWWRLPYDTSS